LVGDRSVVGGWGWFWGGALDRISGWDGLIGFGFGYGSAGIAAFGSMPERDVEVGLAKVSTVKRLALRARLVPPWSAKKIFWLTCKSVQTREIKRLQRFPSGTDAGQIAKLDAWGI
jgi:hypothetical protein